MNYSRTLLSTILFALCSTVAAQQIEEDVDSYSKMLRELVSSTKKRDYESPLKSIGDWQSKYKDSHIKNYVEGHQTIIKDVSVLFKAIKDPQYALDILNKIKKPTANNLICIAAAYFALGQKAKAKEILQKVGKSKEEYSKNRYEELKKML